MVDDLLVSCLVICFILMWFCVVDVVRHIFKIRKEKKSDKMERELIEKLNLLSIDKEIMKTALNDLKNSYSEGTKISIEYLGNVFNNQYNQEKFNVEKHGLINYLVKEIEFLDSQMGEIITRIGVGN